MDAMKLLGFFFVLIAAFALSMAADESVGGTLGENSSVSGGVTAGLYNRQRRQFGYGGYPGGGFGASNSFANANAFSGGGGGLGGGFSSSGASANAGSSNFGGGGGYPGFGRK